MRRRRSRPAASGCARCWSCSAPGRARARWRSGPRPRSSWSTWRPSSTTTSSTRRRCAAAGRPWSRAPAAIARWRSATCCSRAPSPCSARNGDGRQVELLSAPRSPSPAASWPSAATPSTSISAERYLERCELKTARLFECACLIGGSTPTRRRPAPQLGALRTSARDRPRLPAPRRRPRRHRPARADRQGARHRPARRHGDPAADPGPGARRLAGRARTCAASTPAARGGGLRPDRRDRASWTRSAPAPRRRVELAKRALERSGRSSPSSASCSSWSPTASSSATPERRGFGGRGLEVLGEDVVRAEGGDEALDLVLHVGADQDVADRRAPTRCRGRAPRRGGRRCPGCSGRRRSTRIRGSAARRASAARSPAPSRSGRRAPSCRTGRRAGRHASAGWRRQTASRRCWARARAQGRARSRRASLSAALPLRMLYRRCAGDALGHRPQA